MPKGSSGQEPRVRRESLESAPGYNGNDFPDNTKNHIVYNGGMTKDSDWDVSDEGEVMRDIRQKFGIGQKAAMDEYRGVRAFTDYYYTGIRQAQQNGETTGKYADWGTQVEKFIADGVASGHGWSGGTTYRGIAVDDDTLQGIMEVPIGTRINVQGGGSASWATDVRTSQGFAEMGRGGNHVVFVNLDHTQRGVSVAGFSSNGYGEHEVLCSKDNKYRKVGTYNAGNYVYVYVRND